MNFFSLVGSKFYRDLNTFPGLCDGPGWDPAAESVCVQGGHLAGSGGTPVWGGHPGLERVVTLLLRGLGLRAAFQYSQALNEVTDFCLRRVMQILGLFSPALR